MSALKPSSGLLGKGYTKETEAGSDHHLHILTSAASDGVGGEGLWRIRLEAVDGWAPGAEAAASGDDRGPFALVQQPLTRAAWLSDVFESGIGAQFRGGDQPVAVRGGSALPRTISSRSWPIRCGIRTSMARRCCGERVLPR